MAEYLPGCSIVASLVSAWSWIVSLSGGGSQLSSLGIAGLFFRTTEMLRPVRRRLSERERDLPSRERKRETVASRQRPAVRLRLRAALETVRMIDRERPRPRVLSL